VFVVNHGERGDYIHNMILYNISANTYLLYTLMIVYCMSMNIRRDNNCTVEVNSCLIVTQSTPHKLCHVIIHTYTPDKDDIVTVYDTGRKTLIHVVYK